MTDAELQALVNRYTWFHSLQLRPNVWSQGTKPPATLAAEADAVFGPLAMAGRSILDIGAWNGFFSFEACRRGAAKVLATDSFTWNHPDYRGRETLELARFALGLDDLITTQVADPMALEVISGTHDVTLFLGVFYHLINPIPAIFALRRLTRQVLVVETHQDALHSPRPMMVFYPGKTLANDPTNWWGPNPALMYELLTEAGFARVLYRPHPACPPGAPNGLADRRGIYHAFVSPNPSPLETPGGHAGWLNLADPAQRAQTVHPG